MPLAACTTPANGNERAQVMPLLDAVTIKTGKRGRPRKRPKVLAADKGYDSKALRQQLRQRGIRAQLPKRVWKTRKPRGRPLKMDVPRFQAERTFAWFQKKYRRLGRPLGASLDLLQRVSGHCPHPYLDAKADSGIDFSIGGY